jgi:hypothetical protein
VDSAVLFVWCLLCVILLLPVGNWTTSALLASYPLRPRIQLLVELPTSGREKQRSRSTCACVLLIIVGDRAVGCRGLYAASVQCYSTTALPCKTISTSVRNLTISSDHLYYLLSALFSSCVLNSLKKTQKSPHSYYLKSFPQCVPLPSSLLWPWLLSPWPRIN